MPIITFLSSLLNVAAVTYQRRYNRLHKSIKGLSYDSYVLSFVSNLLAIYSGLNYMFSPLVRKQLTRRFPIYYPSTDSRIPVSKLIMFGDILNLACTCAILEQLVRYRYTKCKLQSVSSICISTIVICIVLCVFSYACASIYLPYSDSGKYGIFYLEHINYIWVLGGFLSGFRLLPQITLNFMRRSTQGISSKFLVLSMLSSSLQLGFSLTFHSQQQYRVPLNSKPIYDCVFQLIFLISLLCQAQYVYRHPNRRPTEHLIG
ncbi:LADA_0H16116g1_1 [Lachancea dasiensis]|uniref:LADA_0H16116g1_1 n=1 Tax=Lachancea dasiensis TaxID=1072105 RepID=A0A1G4K561_9SACH|nr:LADA_0H16116g1_1 [Lachancea dasiensis]